MYLDLNPIEFHGPLDSTVKRQTLYSLLHQADRCLRKADIGFGLACSILGSLYPDGHPVVLPYGARAPVLLAL